MRGTAELEPSFVSEFSRLDAAERKARLFARTGAWREVQGGGGRRESTSERRVGEEAEDA